jgi:hypothetical protein
MESIEKEFVPYDIALELKQLGFDEPCFGYYLCKNSAFGVELELTTNWIDLLPYDSSSCKAPTYSQAFRWFREKYDLFISITHYENGYSINDLRRFDTYEEAELACLRELIKIVKGEKA